MSDEGRPDSATASATATVFWDQRHRELDDLRSGGNRGWDTASNEILYAVRLGRLIDVMGDATAPLAPLRVLDAGCGKGYYARAMARFGHRVDGIDLSEFAISECKRQAVAYESYVVSSIDLWQPPYLYDFVYAVDVLFHIMDDGLWERSVVNLGRLVRLGGVLSLAEHKTDVDRTWSDYQRTRAPSRYRALLEPAGFRFDRFEPYDFRGTDVGFLVLTRVG